MTVALRPLPGGDTFLDENGHEYVQVATVLRLLPRRGLERHLRNLALRQAEGRLRAHLGQVVDEALVQGVIWAQGPGNGRAAAGAATHRLLLGALVGRERAPREWAGAVQGLRRWLAQVGATSWQVEKPLADPALRVCGRVDLLAETPMGPALLELKATPRLYPEHHLQVAAYCRLVGRKASGYLGQMHEGRLTVHRVSDLPSWERLFELLASLWWALHDLGLTGVLGRP